MIRPRPKTTLPPGAMKAIDWKRTFCGPISRCRCSPSPPAGAEALAMLSLLFDYPPVRRVRHDHDLAERTPLLELRERLAHPREWIHRMHDRLELPVGH